MEQEKYAKAEELKRKMSFQNMILERLDNKVGHFKLNFGICINEAQTNFMSITDKEFGYPDPELLVKLMAVTRESCEKQLKELQVEFDKL